MNLVFITDDADQAAYAQDAGIDRIMVDLEVVGKYERQGHLDTVISNHSLEDVECIRSVLSTSKLMVRINPINNQSKIEIDGVIKRGANIVMLPMFKTSLEVETFVQLVNGRAKVCLLLETK